MNDPHCIFCFKAKSQVGEEPCASFKMHHEYPEALVKQQSVKQKDAKLCTKCGLHPKNPASATNGCAHEYAQ